MGQKRTGNQPWIPGKAHAVATDHLGPSPAGRIKHASISPVLKRNMTRNEKAPQNFQINTSKMRATSRPGQGPPSMQNLMNRQSIRTTSAGLNSAANNNRQSLSTMKSQSPAKFNVSLKSAEFIKSRIQNELNLILKEHERMSSLAKSKLNTPSKKTMADPERWRNKFRFLFQRERILSFACDDANKSLIFNKRGLASTLEPKVLRPALGSWLLQHCATFWILFAEFNRQKIEFDIDAKERVRRQIVDAFWNCPADDESCLSHNVAEDANAGQEGPTQQPTDRSRRLESQRLLKQHLDRLLYLPEVGSGSEDKDKEVLDQTLVMERNDLESSERESVEEYK